MYIGSSYPVTFLYADPYTDGFWNWMADNNSTEFAGWDALSGSQKATWAAAYTTATGLTSVRTVKIDLSRDGGMDGYDEALATAVSLSTDPSVSTVWNWNPVIGPATTQAKFRIMDEADATIVQYSGLLTIEAAPVTIRFRRTLSPLGSRMGSRQLIGV